MHVTIGKVLKKTHKSNSINIDAFNTGYDTLVRSKMVTKFINVCSNDNVDLVERSSATSSDNVNNMGCDKNMTKIIKVKKITPVLCIYTSMRVGDAFLLSSLVPNTNLLGNKLFPIYNFD